MTTTTYEYPPPAYRGPQTGCELTGGTAYITAHTRAVRAKAAQQ